VAVAIAEDNTAHKEVVKDIKAIAQQAAGFEMFGDGVNFSFQWRPGDLPLRKIKSGYHFAAKREEPLLQLADVCSFVVRRRLQGTDTENLLDVLTLNRTCEVIGLNNPYVGNGMIAFA
jgi:hypothetical protein